MTHLFSMAVLLLALVPQNQTLPDEFHRIPKRVRERATVIVSGTYTEGRGPCELLPDGSRRWAYSRGFDITQVHRGEVGSHYIGVRGAMLPNSIPSGRLESGARYLLLLRPGPGAKAVIKTGQRSHYYWNALRDEEILAIVERQ